MKIKYTEGPETATCGPRRFERDIPQEVDAELGAALLKKETIRFVEVVEPPAKTTKKEK